MERPFSSSKVTVEYFDPFNVYQLLSPGLLPRLPLRNLHWESHAGPLRSIKTLYVDLVPSDQTRPLASPLPAELSRVKSSGSTGVDDGFRVQTLGAPVERPDSRSGPQRSLSSPKSRRHQIPGLRQTPYLKILLLRCDDNDTYKSQTRKQIREWIKEHTPAAQTSTKVNAQENHDAFEWMILHVIVPNTAAATQPRYSAKGSSTLLEKLKADFNGGSKSSADRIAQIRIGVNDVPYDLLPRVIPAIPGSYSETPQEHEESWQDLNGKLKLLILASFDSRVSQYEDDIKEKDAQRAIPGWNFCTFFILKEGLARGFESVGLVEDSLVGYDELTVGLDAIIGEQAAAGSGNESSGSFLPFTEDLRSQLEKLKLSNIRETGGEVEETDGPIDMQSSQETLDQDEIPLIATKKKYRDLILANNISIFDFRCYIFARQLSLLLRMGNAWSSQEELLAKLKEQRESSLQGVAARQAPLQPSEETENLSILAEVCRRALGFITSISSIMRNDLLRSQNTSQNGQGGESQDSAKPEENIMMSIIENVVTSFTFSVAQQILAQTSTKSLPIPPSTLAPPTVYGQEQKASIPEPKTMIHPARSTSLVVSGSSTGQPKSPGVFPGRRSSVPDVVSPSMNSPFLKPGLEELAAHRAELYLLSRGVLEQLGGERGWEVGWDAVNDMTGDVSTLKNVDLDGEHPTKNKIVECSSFGMSNALLRTALSTDKDFYRLYETLTDKALRHYTVASHTQSVQTAMADLAILQFHLKDYAAAASYFYRMTPFYGEGGWEQIEMCMLVMYSKCLKELKRNDEYVRVALKLLAKGAAREKDRLTRKSAPRIGLSFDLGDAENISVDGYLTELLAITPSLQNEVNIPLRGFFAGIQVEGGIQYHEEEDSFALQLGFKYLLIDELRIERARVRIVPVVGGQARDIWLENDTPVVFKKGTPKIQVQSNVLIPGTYIVQQIVLHAGKMVFAHEADPPGKNQGPQFLKSPRLLLYQRPQSFDLKISASRCTHLSRTRNVEIALCSGWNSIESGELHVRAATAGLRLQTSEVKGDLIISRKPEPGVIRFEKIDENESVKIRIPFNVENEVPEITLKLEISYTTKNGTFFYACNPSMKISLPLGVSVQDVFKHKALFSKFSVSSATASPLRLLSSKLEDSEVFEACKGGELKSAITVFPKQQASILYKISKKESAKMAARVNKDKATMSLVLHYICLEEEIDNAITQELDQALKNTEFGQYSRLVIPTLLRQLHTRLSHYDLERTALLNYVSTSVLADMKWQDYFIGLGLDRVTTQETASSLGEWLRSWVTQHPTIPLLRITINDETIKKARSIIIPVDVPSISVVHTADLRLDPKPVLQSGELVAMTNQPLSATLKIKWTRKWETQPPPAGKQWDLEFVYEVSAPPDMWLLGGKRKGHFKVSGTDREKEGSAEFPVLLIPVKEGHLPYPNLDIRTVSASKQNAGGKEMMEGSELPSVSFETDYKNSGEVIRIISNARKTTVSLDASGPRGGAWLLESERRTTEKDVYVG